MLTYEDIRKNESINTYIKMADKALSTLGFTEHSFAHVSKVSATVKYIMQTMGCNERETELAMIAAYLHDIGNLVNRSEHSQSGAVMAFRILDNLGMAAEEIAAVVTAIGNHDEGTGVPVDEMAAALILADKCDVRRSRVRNRDFASFDIHDRVNYSVEKSELLINEDKTKITLYISIDTKYCSIMDYFEIFLDRMTMCRRAAEKFNLKFKIEINGQELL